ncbi:hypothetical protein V5O48_014633 [Marasmius crinis-equi]|uniref:Peptidase C15, pyroglutamyl peptidase I-like protein n=1 Tax=Marasmius crinis-equi TaxID=585013 RepID=A0ABR3EWQ6_9AGAR
MAPLTTDDSEHVAENDDSRILNVLVTGFGPFRNYDVNPSWLAVKPLHNTLIPLDPYDPITLSDGQVVMSRASHPDPAGYNVTGTWRESSEDSVEGEEEEIVDEVELVDEQPPEQSHSKQTQGCYAKITTLEVPVVYSDVLDIVPGLHRKPPEFPDTSSDSLYAHPPPHGYDLVLHVGVAGRGPMRVEKMAHKLGYYMKDATGALAPIVTPGTDTDPILEAHADSPLSRNSNGNQGSVSVSVSLNGAGVSVLPHPQVQQHTALLTQGPGVFSAVSVAEAAERERLGANMVEEIGGSSLGLGGRPLRGFGEGYRRFPEELYSDVDVLELVRVLKRCGIESVTPSMDAGHYLCDFTYYCSLAEAQRNGKPYEKDKTTKVLFLHCPPVDQPCSTAEVTETIKRIVVWVCSGLGSTN